jgi:hypothetical protein
LVYAECKQKRKLDRTGKHRYQRNRDTGVARRIPKRVAIKSTIVSRKAW